MSRVIERGGRIYDPEPKPPEPRYVGIDREERLPSAAEYSAYDRAWYDWQWRRYLNGESSYRPDEPEG